MYVFLDYDLQYVTEVPAQKHFQLFQLFWYCPYPRRNRSQIKRTTNIITEKRLDLVMLLSFLRNIACK